MSDQLILSLNLVICLGVSVKGQVALTLSYTCSIQVSSMGNPLDYLEGVWKHCPRLTLFYLHWPFINPIKFQHNKYKKPTKLMEKRSNNKTLRSIYKISSLKHILRILCNQAQNVRTINHLIPQSIKESNHLCN